MEVLAGCISCISISQQKVLLGLLSLRLICVTYSTTPMVQKYFVNWIQNPNSGESISPQSSQAGQQRGLVSASEESREMASGSYRWALVLVIIFCFLLLVPIIILGVLYNRGLEENEENDLEISQLQREIRNETNYNTQLETERYQIMDTNAQLYREIQNLTGSNTQLEREIQNLTDFNTKLQRAIQNLTECYKSNIQLQRENTNFTDFITRLQRENMNLTDANIQLQRKNQDLSNYNMRLQTENGILKYLVSTLQTRNKHFIDNDDYQNVYMPFH